MPLAHRKDQHEKSAACSDHRCRSRSPPVAVSGPGSAPETGSASEPVAPSAPVSMNKADYPVFPDADAGADPSVPAEQGGKGFTGKGWETNTDFDLIGDPRALKGGVLRDILPDFPGTLAPGRAGIEYAIQLRDVTALAL